MSQYMCPAFHPLQYQCTLDPGHKGEHVAEGKGGRVWARWDDAGIREYDASGTLSRRLNVGEEDAATEGNANNRIERKPVGLKAQIRMAIRYWLSVEQDARLLEARVELLEARIEMLDDRITRVTNALRANSLPPDAPGK